MNPHDLKVSSRNQLLSGGIAAGAAGGVGAVVVGDAAADGTAAC